MTSDGDALFRAVCEHPTDDLPRLVYADWLEENGRAGRAEFIRLQCELARLPTEDPAAAPLLARQDALLRANRTAWQEELPVARAPSVSPRKCRRAGSSARDPCDEASQRRDAAGFSLRVGQV